MRQFVSGEVDVLVSTMIVESGLDVPNANTMFVNRADHFGLAQLYQLRGRVGRSHRRAYCYLIVPESVDADAERRLQVLEHHTELGAGYRIALKDLELRGAGQPARRRAVGLRARGRVRPVPAACSRRPCAALMSGDAAPKMVPADVTIDIAELPARRLRRVAGREDRRLQASRLAMSSLRRSRRCARNCAIGSGRFRSLRKRCLRSPNCGSLEAHWG